MTEPFTPHLGILPPPQRRLWDELASLPAEFILYGGTAIALHLGHRNSVDFDFFAFRPIDPDKLLSDVSILQNADIVQREENTLSVIVNRDGPVKLSFFGLPTLSQLIPAVIPQGHGLKIASLLDLAGMKASWVQKRAEAKDYIDIDALIALGRTGLPMALAAARGIYGRQFNPQITLKALSFFDDGNLIGLSADVKARLMNAVREVDLDNLPMLPAMMRTEGEP